MHMLAAVWTSTFKAAKSIEIWWYYWAAYRCSGNVTFLWFLLNSVCYWLWIAV